MPGILELPLVLQHHAGRVSVHADADGGWNVTIELDGRDVASDHCADWRCVERFRERMERWLRMAETQQTERSACVR